jgi:iron(III) transport system ATP-binding protein
MLEVKSVAVTFKSHHHSEKGAEILRDLSFELAEGQIGCLLGASGSGKTTALRVLAGFAKPSAGSISLGGRVLAAPGQFLPPEKRGIGIVFQDYGLFPHLNVLKNVAFGLKKSHNHVDRQNMALEMIELVGLVGYAERYPHELSGGQQQRVALARALAPSPALLLLDEPFSNLDPDLRERLAQELRVLLKRRNTTALLVTHDQYEAFALADQVGVLENGLIAQWDNAYNLYHRPKTPKVADFVGLGCFLKGRVSDFEAQPTIELELGKVAIDSAEDAITAKANANKDQEVMILLRPDDVVHDDASPVQARVERKAFRGAEFLYTLKLKSGAELLALVPSHHNHAIGEPIGIRIIADHIVTFPLA